MRCDVSKSIKKSFRKMEKQPILTNFTLAILIIAKTDRTSSIFLFFSSNYKLVADIKSFLQNKGQKKINQYHTNSKILQHGNDFEKIFMLTSGLYFYAVPNGSNHVITKYTSSTTNMLKYWFFLT